MQTVCVPAAFLCVSALQSPPVPTWMLVFCLARVNSLKGSAGKEAMQNKIRIFESLALPVLKARLCTMNCENMARNDSVSADNIYRK